MSSAERAMRVLIVEDELAALELMQWWTEDHGWEVRTARSGQVAVEIGKLFKPDVLITDYCLQDDVNGADVIQQLRNVDASVRCVLVTGLLPNALGEDARRLHDVPVLTKPFTFKRLGELIENGEKAAAAASGA
jgi:two-component system, cell cycle sensor histidine kinase and response regulator CckA